jgi:hypothetical protein
MSANDPKRPSGLLLPTRINGHPFLYGLHDLNVGYCFWIYFKWVVREDNQVGKFAGLNRAFPILCVPKTLSAVFASLLRIRFSLLATLGRGRSNALRCRDFLRG